MLVPNESIGCWPLTSNVDCHVSTSERFPRKACIFFYQRHLDKLVKSGLSQEEATAQSQELQHAYKVLSDPKERVWYDSHHS